MKKVKPYGKLRGLITEKFGTQEVFASAWGKAISTVSLKMNGIIPWTKTDIVEICELLGIPVEETHIYFF